MQKKAMTIPEFCKVMNISRSLGYKLAAEGKLPVIRLGEKRIMIPVAAVEKMLCQPLGENA